MHAHKHRLVGLDIPLDYSDMLQAVALLAERDEAEVAVGRRQMDFFPLLHQGFHAQAVGDEVAD